MTGRPTVADIARVSGLMLGLEGPFRVDNFAAPMLQLSQKSIAAGDQAHLMEVAAVVADSVGSDQRLRKKNRATVGATIGDYT